jgi:FixJ family two-component response regulator
MLCEKIPGGEDRGDRRHEMRAAFQRLSARERELVPLIFKKI